MYPIQSKEIHSKTAIYLLIGIGILIRLFHFFYNRSLWMDEVYLSTSIVKMKLADLISSPLYYQQKAPIGFLFVVKIITTIFGDRETALRLIPLISGIISMFLFIPISKYFLKGFAPLLALGILCLSPALVYHSVEIKQYSTELLGTMLSLYFYIKLKDKKEIKSLIIWGLAGAIILWFSYSSIFILAGIGIALSLNYLLQKEWKALGLTLIPSFIWLASFIINYVLFTHKHAESEWIAYWFRAYHNFMPLPPKSISDLKWFAVNIYRMLDYPLGLLWNFIHISSNQTISMILKMPFLPILFLFTGIYTTVNKNFTEMLILSLPILLMFLASGLELYPLTERFWVFISPIFIIIIAEGYNFICTFFNSKKIKIVLIALILIGPLILSVQSILEPQTFFVHKKSFQREALEYLNNQYQNGDAVYIYWNNLPGYRLYKEIYHYKFEGIEGSDQRKNSTNYENYFHNLRNDFIKFKNKKRVWVVFNSQFLTDIGDKIDEPKWYYNKNSSPNQHLINELVKQYVVRKKHITKDVTVLLLEPK
ncbi:glycosyltransferase family 39 protein [Pedobacter aquatilis]|uniref:glycosyltransferase family 39 protein n=1 Tax=Pedobacter aquatilis TaxID=351343 RepID=UPI002930714F|nr:glycosyltransferase family 39 protein [Pedobacter aquatilis]